MLRLHRRALHREPLVRRRDRVLRAQGRRAPGPRLRPRAAAVVGRGQICRAVPALLPGKPVLTMSAISIEPALAEAAQSAAAWPFEEARKPVSRLAPPR